MKIFTCFLCVAFFGMSLSLPSKNGYRRHGPQPQRAVMISGYYNNPLFRRSYDYVPQGSMSAVVTRDAVATNSFAGAEPPLLPTDDLPLEENEALEPYTEKVESPVQPYLPPETEEVSQEAISSSDEVAIAEEVATEVPAITKSPKKAPKRITKKPTKDDDDEDGLAAVWPFAAGKGAVPSYNAFFPITITGSGVPARTRTGAEQEDYYPGAATAIANSFSTGKGGIATSHATSFGDPYLASLVRNGLLNFRSNKGPQDA